VTQKNLELASKLIKAKNQRT